MNTKTNKQKVNKKKEKWDERRRKYKTDDFTEERLTAHSFLEWLLTRAGCASSLWSSSHHHAEWTSLNWTWAKKWVSRMLDWLMCLDSDCLNKTADGRQGSLCVEQFFLFNRTSWSQCDVHCRGSNDGRCSGRIYGSGHVCSGRLGIRESLGQTCVDVRTIRRWIDLPFWRNLCCFSFFFGWTKKR